jgi:NADH-quinone oxidoreductase subunit G
VGLVEQGVEVDHVAAARGERHAVRAKHHAETHMDEVDVTGIAKRPHQPEDLAEMQLLPRVNDAINEEWISDKTRHVWDGLRVQRLDRPYLRRNGRLEAVSWDEAFRAIAERLRGLDGGRFATIAGDLAAAEEMFAQKLLASSLPRPVSVARTAQARSGARPRTICSRDDRGHQTMPTPFC